MRLTMPITPERTRARRAQGECSPPHFDLGAYPPPSRSWGTSRRLSGRDRSKWQRYSHLAPYLDLLDRVLEDHLVTDVEAELLAATAADWAFPASRSRGRTGTNLGSLVKQA